jgi:hypothetical protein
MRGLYGRALIGGLAVFLSVGPAIAQSTKPAEQELQSLIAKLSSDVFKERQQAQDQIVAIGEPARASIKSLMETTKDAELRTAAESILARIPDQSARSDPSKGTLVSLHFANAPAQEAYESLYHQVGAKLLVSPPGLWTQRPRNVTIDVDNVPFWNAFQNLREQTHLSLDPHGSTNAVCEDPARSPGAPVSIRGPFMVIPESSLGGRFDPLIVFVEPKIRIISHKMRADITEASDADGKSVSDSSGGFENVIPSDGNVFKVLTFLRPHGRGGIMHIKGTVRASVLTEAHKIEFDNIREAHNRKQTLDGHRFLINMMEPEPGNYEMTFVAYNKPPIPGFKGMVFTLVDAEGRVIGHGGHGGHFTADRADHDLDFQQTNQGPAAKLIVEFPTLTNDINIPFEFGQAPKPINAR